VADKRE